MQLWETVLILVLARLQSIMMARINLILRSKIMPSPMARLVVAATFLVLVKSVPSKSKNTALISIHVLLFYALLLYIKSSVIKPDLLGYACFLYDFKTP